MCTTINSCWQGNVALVFLSISVVPLIIFILCLVKAAWRKPVPLNLSATFLTLFLILGTAALADYGYSSNQNRFGDREIGLIVPWLVLLALFFILFLFITVQALRKNSQRIEVLEHIWDMRKGYGGNAFGDFANATGVIAGVGAYAATFFLSWLLTGLMGAFLATAVGMSLLYRWVRKDDDSDRRKRFTGVLNIMVGIFTFLSLMSPTLKPPPADSSTTPSTPPPALNAPFLASEELYSVAMVILGTFLIAAVAAFFVHRKRKKDGNRPLVWVFIIWPVIVGLFLLAFGLYNWFYWDLARSPAADQATVTANMAYAFGLLAFLAWMLAELLNIIFNAIDLSKPAAKPETFLVSIFKSVLEIAGAALLLTFVTQRFADSNAGDISILATGAAIAGVGALLGVFISSIGSQYGKQPNTGQQFAATAVPVRARSNNGNAARLQDSEGMVEL